MSMNRMMATITISASILMLAGTTSEAGFGLPKKSSGGGGDIKAKQAELEKKTTSAVEKCAVARLTFIDAQGKMLDALGLKVEAETLKAEAKALSEGNTSASELKKNVASTKAADDAIKSALAQGKELSPESKKKFAEGVVTFADGLAQETALVAVAVELGEAAKYIAENASGFAKADAIKVGKPALEIAAMVPGDIKEATATLGSIIAYCKKQGIELPKDVTDLI